MKPAEQRKTVMEYCLGAAVAAQPEKLDAVEAVVNSILTNA